MSLQKSVTDALKIAMKLKDTTSLTALRSIKSALLLFQTKKSQSGFMSQIDEINLLQKLVKQRHDSANIFKSKDRHDLAEIELNEAKIISQFLPKMLSDIEVEDFVINALNDLGASTMKDMGRVMSFVAKELSGKTDKKTISIFVKKHLST